MAHRTGKSMASSRWANVSSFLRNWIKRDINALMRVQWALMYRKQFWEPLCRYNTLFPEAFLIESYLQGISYKVMNIYDNIFRSILWPISIWFDRNFISILDRHVKVWFLIVDFKNIVKHSTTKMCI